MKAKAKLKEAKPMRLDLGCGPNKRDGFEGVDVLPFDGKVDHIVDLRKKFIWDNGVVDEVHSSHFVEHLTGGERIHFFNELFRVMKTGAKGTIITPHWGSGRAYGDPTHQWPPVVEFFWYYLDKGWREKNAPHCGLDCDFSVTWGYSTAHPWSLKTQEAQSFAINHYREVAQDMIATIVKK